MYRTEEFGIILTRPQAREICSIRDSQRFTYNWTVGEIKKEPTLTAYDLSKRFTTLRQATPHLQQIPRAFQNVAIFQARAAADLANKRGNGNVKFRSKKRDRNISVECGLPPVPDGHSIKLPRFGTVRTTEEIPRDGAKLYRFICVTSNPKAKPQDMAYRLQISYKYDDPEPRHTGVSAGVDRGITNPTVVYKSSGKLCCYDTVTPFQESWRQQNKDRSRQAKGNKHSRTWRARHSKMQRRQNEIDNIRTYIEWKLAKKICEGMDTIYVEDLHLESMTRKGGRYKTGMNRGLRFARHAEILQKVRTVAERLGIRVVEVDPRYTSKKCCVCQNLGNREGERFECMTCGRVMNADGNAATNVQAWGSGTTPKIPAGEGTFLERRELGRTRNPPVWVIADPDGVTTPRRDNTSAKSSRDIKRPKCVGTNT